MGGEGINMDPEVLYRILAIISASCLYCLCAWNLVRYAISPTKKTILLKLSLLGVGLFAALIVGFVVLLDTVGSLFACGYTVVILCTAIVLNSFFHSRWEAQEHAHQQQIETLKANVEVLRDRANKNKALSLEEACRRAANSYELTRREEEVLGFLLQELSYAEIEKRLYLSHSTVKSHVRNLYRKMEVNRRESLAEKVDDYNE